MTTVLATGDLVLETPDATALLAAAVPVLAGGDVVIGHLEVPHVHSARVLTTDVPALPAPPSALDAVAAAGFDVLTLAGNHVFDFGPEGIAETRRHCADRGMLTAGAGDDFAEALAPAIVADGERRVAVLSVNCVGPRETWATSLKPGAAYIEVITHYETRGANPGGPPRIHTFADQRSLQRVADAVRETAATGAVVVVALHKGLVHVPAEIADYEREISHAMVDAGAHVVLGHHAHIFKGVEIYRDRPIFHGLGNFATVTQALTAKPGDAAERAAWARQRVRLFGFVPDPAMPDYPFHPESRNTAIARADVSADGTVSASLVPCWIDDDARPVPTGASGRGESVGEYIRAITAEAGFDTSFTWHDDRLLVAQGGSAR
ncbi:MULTISPECIES: CapA family protein [Microbacterium]|uniref:CapA family protein n=1 Tax=Microbacterium wangchenii TaxID=2541726 RepID=A0ABX5SZT2_9MICO|nr:MULTISPECIES: CapA family protein [Microbacterium]MCK6066065.1 CapA family protein [Microbacterium sp. EYE_512]QBR90349.1 CapA family protein [Microbacterium wangchenii]TXK11635.1 CapA family protein [Microbacterium wangchenii]